jgi:hypothetical protein
VNVDIHDHSDTTQAVSSVIGDDLIQFFAEQWDLYHRHNVDKWKISPQIPEIDWYYQHSNVLRSDTSDGPSQKK